MSLTELIPDQHCDAAEDVRTQFSIPGLPLLSKTMFPSTSRAETQRCQKLERDISIYESKAKEFVEKIKEDAISKNQTELAVPDPLSFWLSQVEYLPCM